MRAHRRRSSCARGRASRTISAASAPGTAPVTKRSGKSVIVVCRLAVHNRLQNVVYHWAGSATQRDAVSKAKHAALRARGHARALRSVADRLLAVACAMLENRTMNSTNY